MAASCVLRSDSPNMLTRLRAIAELVTVVIRFRQRPSASRTSSFGEVDVATFVDDDLLDRRTGSGQHFGQHFAAAARPQQ